MVKVLNDREASNLDLNVLWNSYKNPEKRFQYMIAELPNRRDSRNPEKTFESIKLRFGMRKFIRTQVYNVK